MSLARCCRCRASFVGGGSGMEAVLLGVRRRRKKKLTPFNLLLLRVPAPLPCVHGFTIPKQYGYGFGYGEWIQSGIVNSIKRKTYSSGAATASASGTFQTATYERASPCPNHERERVSYICRGRTGGPLPNAPKHSTPSKPSSSSPRQPCARPDHPPTATTARRLPPPHAPQPCARPDHRATPSSSSRPATLRPARPRPKTTARRHVSKKPSDPQADQGRRDVHVLPNLQR